MSRDPEAIQREIESARSALAASLDQLAERASPSRLVENGKRSVKAFLVSPAGIAVIGGTSALLALLVVRRVRLARRDDDD